MAASATAIPSPKSDGGNALAILMAAAAGSMHRHQAQQIQQQHHQHHQHQQKQQHQLQLQQQQQQPLQAISYEKGKRYVSTGSQGNHNTRRSSGGSSSSGGRDKSASHKAVNGGNILAKLFDNNIKQHVEANPIKNNKSIDIAATSTGTTTTSTTTSSTNCSNSNGRSRIKTSHKSSTSSTSSISTSTDKESTNAAKLLASLFNGSLSQKPATEEEAEQHVELRFLESWHDESGGLLDESCYQELVDPSNSNGWSADEMFKYNEKRHKVTSSYNEKASSAIYTTPLPKTNSKTTARMATQLAKEIEERKLAEGRITPESSDDDELFEVERLQKFQSKQQRQLDQLKNLKSPSHHRFSNNQAHMTNMSTPSCRNTKSSSQYSNSTATPATASLSSSPTLNDSANIIKPVTSSSRNILRTSLT